MVFERITIQMQNLKMEKTMPDTITIIKKNAEQIETWRYQGQVMCKNPQAIQIQARFNRDDMSVGGILFKRDDLFVETFYSDRWYNIFEIYDKDSGQLKAWYCNVCFPAVFTPESINYVDLALDLLVKASGEQLILDEDEFEALNLDGETKKKALEGLSQLQALFLSKFNQNNP
jgi:protein associated with RNAse G/E